MRRAVALVFLLAASAARADILLDGHQHIGDEDTRAEFTPVDPVRCDRYQTHPSHFELTQSTTITAVTLHDAVGLDDDDITIEINRDRFTALSCTACEMCTGPSSCGDVTIDLLPDVLLGPGTYQIAVIDPSGASGNCATGNDYGFSGITLVSAQASTSRMLNRRRHVGDDNDTDDDYDVDGEYPDAFEGSFVDMTFSLDVARRLTEVRLYRLRGVDTGNAEVLVDGQFIGNLADSGAPLETNPTVVSTSLLLLAGTHTVRVQSVDISAGELDDFSWDDLILLFTDVGSPGTAGFFNAVDAGEASPIVGPVRTKTAGATHTLDLYALNGFGLGVNNAFAGAADVYLMDATDNTGLVDVYGCGSNWSVAQSLGSVTFASGYAQLTTSFLGAGLREGRIKVTHALTGASGCSVDNFAVKPASFALTPSHGSETTAGTAEDLGNLGTSGLPRHKAGRPFTLQIAARAQGGAAATNYDGTPNLLQATALPPATNPGTLSVNDNAWQALGGGVRRNDTAKYSEAGPAALQVSDSAWASVDADDTAATARTITGTVDAGRFIPDTFRVTESHLTPTCSAFSYIGESLAWNGAAVTLTAVDADGNPTLNYEGALETLPDALGQPTYAVLDDLARYGIPTLVTTGLPAPALSAADAGIASITLPALTFARTLLQNFDAEIGIRLPLFADADGVVPEESPIDVGTAAAGAGVKFDPVSTVAGKQMRFGRFQFDPGHGSEFLPVEVALRAEYYDGASFVQNTLDVCTSLLPTQITLVPVTAGQTLGLAGGNSLWSVTVSAPNTSGIATLILDVVAPGVTGPNATVPYPHLAADNNRDGTYAEDPQSTVTFGLFNPADQRIYQREVVGD